MPTYDYECSKCGKVFEFIKGMSEEPKVWCICGGKATQLISLVHTNKDRLYNFYSGSLGLKIESKTQWKQELKKRGLTDDFNQSWAGRKKDIEMSASSQHSMRKHNHEQIKNSVRDALKGMNMYSKEKLFIPKDKAPRGMVYK